MRSKTIVLAAALIMAPFAAASAQMCMGSFDIAVAPMSAGGQLGIHDNSNSILGTFGFQTRTNWFGQAGVGQNSYDGAGSTNTTIVALRGGRQLTGFSLAEGKVKVCPTGTFWYEDGDGGSLNLLKAGVQFGGEVSRGQQASIRPTGGASLARVGVEAGGFDDSEIGLMLDLGVGFVFNRKISLVPSLNLPLGFDYAEESFLIAVNFAFGGPGSAGRSR